MCIHGEAVAEEEQSASCNLNHLNHHLHHHHHHSRRHHHRQHHLRRTQYISYLGGVRPDCGNPPQAGLSLSATPCMYSPSASTSLKASSLSSINHMSCIVQSCVYVHSHSLPQLCASLSPLQLCTPVNFKLKSTRMRPQVTAPS